MNVRNSSADPLQADAAVGSRVPFAFENTYARLPERFFARIAPARVVAPRLVKLNEGLARVLGVEVGEGAEVFSGNFVVDGAEPLAMAYAGHQFGHFVPQLGDGRANLLGEVVGRDGIRYDIQLKGSGRTPFSRGGDGRAGLGPVLREYVVSEAMAALGVPTTRALAAVTTGETVYRETAVPGAVLTRVASSHLRVGTFQYFWARQDVDGLRTLADYAISRHYPEAGQAKKPYRALLDGVIARQAALVARWMLLGFVHGVMNTDNTSISGETIDYGPCAFLEAYEADKVFSSIDIQGRYAYSNQPHAMHWNLTRLAEALLPLLVSEEGSEEGALGSAREALETFAGQYEAAREAGFRRKLGMTIEKTGDKGLVEDLLARMEANGADFTLTFRRMSEAATGDDGAVRGLFANPAAYDEWAVGWRRRLGEEGASGEERAASMRAVSPAYVPRNHRVEEMIQAALHGDFGPFETLLRVTSRPYEERAEFMAYEVPARPEELVSQTFCGT